MSSPDPNRLYKLACPACGQTYAEAFARHADDLCILHGLRCPATKEQHEAATIDIEFARVTGDCTHLVRKLNGG